MTVEPNEPGMFSHPLSAGDFVQVHLTGDPTMGHQGYVVEADDTFIVIHAHKWIGLAHPDDAPNCIDHPVMYPMASVAFVAQVRSRPVGCPCEEAVS
ncbi:hypothetical protein QWJ41_20410 [Nocardioides sp. SOB44]|uniref:Uncharacterized protein n=1 Tax=Nocardioides cremeus TaxID=3058044 RepID=A0ABT8TVV8_9ACTN|nr:hypothetical protein [Nocardioides cremeus]MDO3398097.1 hypothetical protein [Nocardioides cremeus]